MKIKRYEEKNRSYLNIYLKYLLISKNLNKFK